MTSEALAVDNFPIEERARRIGEEARRRCFVDQPFELNNQGEHNLVLLAPPDIAVKLPRKPSLYAELRHLHAVGVTYRLDDATIENDSILDLQIPFPLVVSQYPSPTYTIFNYVHGDVLPENTVRAFSDQEKEALGIALGKFIAFTAISYPPTEYARELGWLHTGAFKSRVMIDRFYLLKQLMYGEIRVPATGNYRALSQSILDLKVTFDKGWPQSVPRRVVHDDLTAANMTFNGHDLAGIIDFENVLLASPARAMRFLATVGECAVAGAADMYQSITGEPVNPSHIYLWAYAQTLTICARRVQLGKVIEDFYIDRLKLLFPDRDWSELYIHNSRVQAAIAR
jgi:hypothetical protein